MILPAWNRYLDARNTELRRAIADSCACEPDEVLVGTGSDEVIALLLTAPRPRIVGLGREDTAVGVVHASRDVGDEWP